MKAQLGLEVLLPGSLTWFLVGLTFSLADSVPHNMGFSIGLLPA